MRNLSLAALMFGVGAVLIGLSAGFTSPWTWGPVLLAVPVFGYALWLKWRTRRYRSFVYEETTIVVDADHEVSDDDYRIILSDDDGGGKLSAMPDHYDRDGKLITEHDWRRLSADPSYKRVAYDKIGDLEVSTIWRGTDYPGEGRSSVFESVVFGRDDGSDNEQRRYATEEEARAGHAELVAQVRAAASL